MIDGEKFSTMERVAEKLFRGGVFSAEVKSADTAFAIILAGDELGFEPMAAARNVALVKGKVSLSADAMVGLVKRSAVCLAWHVVETSATDCTITTTRTGDASPTVLTYTIAMATRAGLTGSQTWRAHPEAMLRARCGAALARAVYPDVCGGLYDPDEAAEIRRGGAAEDAPTDGPAQAAPVDRVAAFVSDLAAASDLGGVRAVYATYAPSLGGTSARPVTDAVRARLSALGYHLTAVEASALLGGTLPDALAEAYDRLAAVDRHADDEAGDGVVADVVRVVRSARGQPDAVTRRVWSVARATVCALLECDDACAKARLTEALWHPVTVAPVAVAPTHVAVEGTWRATEAGWREHLDGMTVRRRIEASVGCNGEALGEAFVAMAAARIVALDEARPQPVDAPRLTVDGVATTLRRLAAEGAAARAAETTG